MPSSLTISEVYGGGGNSGAYYANDYVVIHNTSNQAISLAGYSIQYASTGGAFSVASASSYTALTGTIAAGGYYLVQEAAGANTGAAALPTPQATGAINMSSTGGKVALSNSATVAVTGPADAHVQDFVGWGAATTYEGAGAAPATSNTTSIVRNADGNIDTDVNSANFTVVTDDSTHVPFNAQTTARLYVTSVSANEGNAGTSPFTFTVYRSGSTVGTTTVSYATADGTATVADNDYVATSGTLTFNPGDVSKTVTVNVVGDTKPEANETFTLNLSNPTAGVTLDQATGTGTIVNDDGSLNISIATLQGASQTSPYNGSYVTTQGVVTAITTGSSGGFYIQDNANNGPAGASHGLFVYTAGSSGAVAVGDAVTVTGTVTEFNAGNNNLSVTELSGTPTFTVNSHNNTVTPIVIGTGGVLPPTSAIAPANPYNPATSGADFYESLEGQLVTVHNALAVDATYSGSTWVVADNGAEVTGLNARGGITIGANDFNPERIQIYSTALNATMGEQLGDITGVLTYYSNNDSQDPSIGGEYELIPTQPVTPPGGQSTTNPPTLPAPTTALKGDATHLSLAAYNVENLGPMEPGVPQSTVDARFALLGQQIANNLQSPDVIGLEEIQDEDGQTANTDLSAAGTLNKLIAAIKAAGGPTYQYVEIDPTTAGSTGGAANGNIRNAYLYNPARVTYVAGSATLINDNDPTNGDAFSNSRHPLAAQFVFNGQTINAIDVHDYARGGSQELFGANQPPVNSGDQKRIDQTAAVNAYVSQLLAANPNANVTVQGDFNAFQFETSLTQLAHGGGGQLNQLSNLLAPTERYSTTFEGDAQEIDHELVSDGLYTGAAFDIVHLNTGQQAANQGSDHDPIVSLLAIAPAPQPAIAGTAAGQATNDTATIAPFAAATVSDASPTAVETVTVTLSAAANGALAGGNFVQTSQGVYAVTGVSAAAAQADLRALVFTPTANQVAPGQTVTTGFTVAVSDGVATATDTTTSVVSTSVNDTPALAGSLGGQTVGDRGTINPFATVTVTDPDVGQTETVTVTLSSAANGTLSGGGFAAAATPGVYTVAAASAAAAQADLRAAVFTPTAAPIGTASTTTTFTVAVNDGVATASDAGTQVTATHTTNTAPALGGFAGGQTNDKTAVQPFAGATVADPDAQTETVTVTLSAAANGTLSGGGFASVGAGSYQVTAPNAAAAQADLRALVFTPAQNQVAPGATVTTTFTVQVNDTQTTVSNSQTTETVTSVNDPAAFGAFQSAAATPTGGAVVLQPTLTVSDPDPGASVASAQVAISAGFTIGDRLTATAPAGITAAYNMQTGVLTLSGGASDAAYQQALESVSFSHDGTVAAGMRTVSFAVVDNVGATTTASESVTVAGYTQPTTGGAGTTQSIPTNLDAQQGYPTQTSNLLRTSASDPAVLNPSSPLYAQAQAEKAIAIQLDSGQIGLADAQNALYHLVDGTTSVAEITYAFFTGRTPTAAGLNYLVHSSANPTDLNDPYYQQFTTENRYINFANNLTSIGGAANAAFLAAYGNLSLSDTVTKAYAAIFGTTPTSDKVSAILSAQVSNGLGGTETRAQYFADITGGSATSQKAAAIGFLLADSVKEGFGAYQQADLHFLADLAHGTAVFNTDLLAAYTAAPTLVGQPVADPTTGG